MARQREDQPLFSVTTKDLEVQTFASGGPGGQNQNKRHTGVRIIHPASGARAESREERSQHQNKRTALKRLVDTPAFRFWVAAEVRRLDGHETPEQWVERQMEETNNIKIEIKDPDGRWTEIGWDDLENADEKNPVREKQQTQRNPSRTDATRSNV